MSQPILSVNHLTLSFTADPILWDVTFSINNPTLLAIIGPNGGGKSSLLRALVGLIKPVAGTISFWGSSWKQKRHEIAYIPQRTSLDWNFPVNALDVVLMGCYGRLNWFARPSKEDRLKAYALLEMVNLSEYAHTPLYALSGGQQQRILLARAFMQDASLYLMDEPFVGIDMATEQEMIKLLKNMRDAHKTIIIIHHDLQTVDEYFDQILLLNRSLIAYGSVQEILMPEYICAAFGRKDVYIPRFLIKG